MSSGDRMRKQYLKVYNFVKEFELLRRNETVVLAVSGGPDSLCLLYIFKNLAAEFKLNLIIAHLNHCLRPEGDHEAAAVAALAKELNLPCEVKAVDIRVYKKTLGVGEEEAGRSARYLFLLEVARKYGASKIATGHHRDDQAETVLLNIIRGSSVDGLSGILPIRKWKGLELIRPLLCLWRDEIESFCMYHQLKPFIDSSNLETEYKRNKLRLELIPHLEEKYNPKIRQSLARLADLAARDRLFLQTLARLNYRKITHFAGDDTIINRQSLKALPPALQGRIAHIALKKYLPAGKINRVHIEQVLKILQSSSTGKKLTLPDGLQLEQSYDRIIISSRHLQVSNIIKPVIVPIPGRVCITDRFGIESRVVSVNKLSWPPGKYEAYLDYSKIPAGAISVRSRKPGDRFFPQGSAGRKKLKDIFIDHKIPRKRRDTIPVVTAGDKIIWLAGFRIAEPYKVTEKTKQVLLLQYKAYIKKNNGKGGPHND